MGCSSSSLTDGPKWNIATDGLKPPSKWKSDPPVTIEELQKKRDEFWDTSPHYGGKKLVWDTLKAAIEASSDQELQIAIITSAELILDDGSLSGDIYDSTGEKYNLPKYMLSNPENLVVST